MKKNFTNAKSSLNLFGLTALLPFVVLSFGFQSKLIAQNQREILTASNNSSISSEMEELLHSYDKKIYFTKNKGQFNDKILYKADFPYGQAVATKQGMLVATYDPTSINARQWDGESIEKEMQSTLRWRPLNSKVKGHAWMMNFLHSSSKMTVSSRTQHSDVYNFYEGKKKIENVENFDEVWYNNVYDNVDVRYYPSEDGTLEYDILCKKGFDKNKIEIRFDGIEKIEVHENGHLVLKTSVGDVDFPAPIVYQKINGVQKNVFAKYIVTGKNTLKFQLGSFDESQPLVIDPIALRWATWVNTNSTGDNHGHCIWVDPTDGAIYVVARVVGTTNLITPGAFDETANGNLETIIGKYLEPTTVGGQGTRVWQTYIGGDGDDNPYAMEQGPDGNLYITGLTSSTNFPLLGGSAFSGSSVNQGAQGSLNIFVLKINRQGNSIKSAVIGGNGDDASYDIRLTEAGDVLICGNTTSTNLATLNPGSGAVNRANTNNGNDALVFKLNQDLSSIIWMKNYGGLGAERANIMLQNNANNDIYVAGLTSSSNFPTLNPRQSTLGGTQSGFLQKLDGAGNFIWSSYFQSASGKASSILCMEFNVNKDQIYFGGITDGLPSSNISSSGVYDNSYNGGIEDFFISRIDTNQNLVASTYLGGSSDEVNMMGLNTDQNNDVYIFGYSSSTNFPVTSSPNTSLQNTNRGGNDKTFTKLSSSLSSVLFSTYFGGTSDDYDPVGQRGIKFSNCRIYTIVTSQSNNLPLTQGALNTTRSSSTNTYEPGLVVWANPPDLLGNTITGNQTICAGNQPTDITGSVPAYSLPTIIRNTTTSIYPSLGTAASYQWQISTDSITWTNIANATSQNLAGSSIGVLFSKTFIRRIIGGDACILAGAADQVVTVRIMSASAAITNVSCFGENDGSLTATSDGVSPFTFVWSNGSTSETISNLSPGTYTVTVTDAGGCTATNSFTITEPALVTAEAGSDIAFTCVAGSTQLNGSTTSQNATYSWVTPDGNITSGANTLNPTINAFGVYFLTVTGPQNGCTAIDSIIVYLNTQNSSSTVDAEICEGESYTLPNGTIKTTSGTFITTIPNAAGCDSVITTNLTVNLKSYKTEDAGICFGDSYSFNGTLYSQTGVYQAILTNAAGCDSIVTLSLTVYATSSSNENATICEGESYLFNGVNYTSQGVYNATLLNAVGCDSIVTLNLTVKSKSNPAISINASATNVNSGDAVTLSVVGGQLGTNADWKWYSGSCGGTFIGSGNSVIVNPTATTTYFVRAEGDCNSTNCVQITININSCALTGIVSNVPNDIVCKGNSVTLSVVGTLGAGASWKWYKGGCCVGAVLSSTGTLTVTPTTTTTYFVRYQGGSCGVSLCKSITIRVISKPAAPSAIVGPANGLCNVQGVVYSVAPVANATNYNWLVPNGASIVSGQGTNSITVNFGSSLSVVSGCGSTPSICVSASNNCGTSSTRNLCVFLTPGKPGSIVGKTTLCKNEIATFTIPPVAGATSYAWSTTPGSVVQSGQGTNTLTLKLGSKSGTLSVKAVNNCGKSLGASLPLTVSSCVRIAEDIVSNELVAIYPNPASTVLYLKANGFNPTSIEVYNMIGELVINSTWKQELSVADLQQGLYIIKVISPDQTYINRVEIIK